MPPEVEWFANLSNAHTRRVYENAVRDFMGFTGIRRPEEFRTVTRAHIIAWRDDLVRRGLGGSTIRHRLASLASLFEYLCDKNAVTHNPVKGVERPKTESGEGKTPVLGDHQARKLLDAPQEETIKSRRDRAILSTLLFHALRREELCKLKVRDFKQTRKGVPHLKVVGKGGKNRYLPLHPLGSSILIRKPIIGCSWLSDDVGTSPVIVKIRFGQLAREKCKRRIAGEPGVSNERPISSRPGRHALHLLGATVTNADSLGALVACLWNLPDLQFAGFVWYATILRYSDKLADSGETPLARRPLQRNPGN